MTPPTAWRSHVSRNVTERQRLFTIHASRILWASSSTSWPGACRRSAECFGRAPFSRVGRLLGPGGRYVVANPHTAQLLRGLWAALTSDKKLVISSGAVKDEHLLAVTALIEASELRPVIDRRYPLEQAAEAHRYADSEQKLGNIVIEVAQARLAE